MPAEMTACAHFWHSNSGVGGTPIFRILYGSRVMHVLCSECDARTWLSPKEWEDSSHTTAGVKDKQ